MSVFGFIFYYVFWHEIEWFILPDAFDGRDLDEEVICGWMRKGMCKDGMCRVCTCLIVTRGIE